MSNFPAFEINFIIIYFRTVFLSDTENNLVVHTNVHVQVYILIHIIGMYMYYFV